MHARFGHRSQTPDERQEGTRARVGAPPGGRPPAARDGHPAALDGHPAALDGDPAAEAEAQTLRARDLRRTSGVRLGRPASRTPTERPGSDARAGRPASDAPLVLGRYRLRRRLGTGGFATVWRAHDERLDRQVAVKILPRERVIGGRFEREARAAARLAHPGIVTLYEAAVDDEGAYLVSELVHGATLDRLLAEGRLSDRDVVRIGIALCDALAHAHAQGVIHRDVKPSNVLVPERPSSPAQMARLTDFGVARVLGGDTLTRTGDVIGTEAYMAPEQAQGLPATPAADLFSLALVLYEALSGANPLRGVIGAARRRAVHLPPLRRQRRELPRELGRSIDLALRPRPSERGTLAELRAALAASVARVEDEPGVVADPWPTRALTRSPGEDQAAPFREQAEPFNDRAGPARDHGRDDAETARREPARRQRSTTEERAGAQKGEAERMSAIPAPRRALAALAAAALAAYLQAHVPGASPLPAALTATVAAAAVAVLPRAGWLALALLSASSLIIHSRPGTALALLAGALIPVIAAPRDGPAWPLAAGAPALNSIGLAAAWPALAGMTKTTHRRAALAATGYLWTVLWSEQPAAITTLPDAVHHVLAPVVAPATLIAAAAWAAAAVTLPLTRSRRWPALEALRLTLWALALGLATLAAEHAGGAIHTGNALLGAVAGALVALVTRWWKAHVRTARSGNDQPTTS